MKKYDKIGTFNATNLVIVVILYKMSLLSIGRSYEPMFTAVHNKNEERDEIAAYAYKNGY
ncbi:hypothetical protein J2T17_007181 [Paenibacillus mucilaginosus]|uniref:hypothetical protein n=1 Tax=Paenibacillus mucilaginosus TaxID=61624 RepID=UPI003D24D32E